MINKDNLKSDSHPSKVVFICFNKNPLRMLKNVFYFILKALFVLKMDPPQAKVLFKTKEIEFDYVL